MPSHTLVAKTNITVERVSGWMMDLELKWRRAKIV